MNRWYKAFVYICNRDRIPKLPRGMLAAKYETIARPEGRVLARLGARDPLGIKVAMKRHKVETIEELVEKLEHYQPRRNIRQRILMALGRALGGYPHDPHRAEILRDERHSRKSSSRLELEHRLKVTRLTFRKKD